LVCAQRESSPETANLDHPFGLPCVVDGEATYAYADSPPFRIRLQRFPSNEGCATIPRHRSRYGKQEARRNDRAVQGAYLDIEANHQYVEHFGFRKFSFYIPFLVKNLHQVNRVEWLKEIILDITGARARNPYCSRVRPHGEVDM